MWWSGGFSWLCHQPQPEGCWDEQEVVISPEPSRDSLKDSLKDQASNIEPPNNSQQAAGFSQLFPEFPGLVAENLAVQDAARFRAANVGASSQPAFAQLLRLGRTCRSDLLARRYAERRRSLPDASSEQLLQDQKWFHRRRKSLTWLNVPYVYEVTGSVWDGWAGFFCAGIC